MTGLMQGKRGLIMGLANDRSLAWGIARKLSEAGAEILHDPASIDPVVGASGAISGLLAAAVMLHPRAWLVLVLPGRRVSLPVPVYVALGGWLGIQGLEAVAADLEAMVAWWSHLGGFVTGTILVLPFRHSRGQSGARP